MQQDEGSDMWSDGVTTRAGLNSDATHVTISELQHEISNNVVCAKSKGSEQPAHMCSLIRAFASRLNIL